jgi:hypothetical protein
LKNTNLEALFKSDFFSSKVYYLSVEEGIDKAAFIKANLSKCQSIYFLSKLLIDKNTESHTQSLVHMAKHVDFYISSERYIKLKKKNKNKLSNY